jgi:hypothetical protein
VGEPLLLGLDIINVGRRDVDLTFVNVESDNGEIVDGDETFLGTLKTTEDTSVSATIMPSDEGPLTITVTFHYLDDLSQEKSIVETYQVEVMQPPPPPEEISTPPPDINAETEEEPDNNDFLGRLLLGLLGLGS